MTRHRAGTATYQGNVEHIVGEVKGPATFGTYAVAVDAHYDPETDLTVVEFAHATDADLEAATLDYERGAAVLDLGGGA